jgi:multiple sugar transport system substrate-binding protein
LTLPGEAPTLPGMMTSGTAQEIATQAAQAVSGTRRRVLGHAVAGLSGVVLAACGGGAQQGAGGGEAAPAAQIKKGAKIVWAVDDGPTRTPLRDDQIKMFKAKFPDITFENVLGATSAEKVTALFAAGTPPDMFRQETAGMALFASKDQIAQLDPYMRRDKYDLSDFFPSAWEQWTWKGKHFGLPFLGIRIVYFNRALTGQINAKVPVGWKDPAWTWDAFLDVTKKATSQGGNARWGTAELTTIRRQWQPWVWNNGGELFSEDGTKVLLDQPAAMETIQFLADLIHKHRVMPTPDELKAAGGRAPVFNAGNLLMYHEAVNGVAANRKAANFDWSVTGLPRGKGKAARSSGGGVGWFMTGASKVRDEVWELMKLLASKESVRLEAERGEAPPSRRSIANEPAFINPPEAPKGDMKVIVEALEAVHTETALLNGVEIDQILDRELGQIWSGQRTARESVAAAVNLIKPLVNPAG